MQDDNQFPRKDIHMRRTFICQLLPVMAFLFLIVCDPHPMTAADTPTDTSSLTLPDTLPAHPRLLLTPEVKARVATLIQTDPWAQRYFQRIEQGAQLVAQTPVITRQLSGDKRKRMLDTSRLVLHNIIIMGMAHTFKPDAQLKDRIIEELMAAVGFEDWHPEHFLDTSEMTLAIAIGYDWLYDQLTDHQRQAIRHGIIELGLKAALTHHGGLNWHNNWNQVRHGSLAAGALAVYEDQPELAKQILQQARDNYQFALHVYEGDGVYPEGPMYWNYGTSFSWVMSACLTSALGDDWGILQSPGFADSFHYVMHVTAPSNKLFNYADCYTGPMDNPLHLWAGNLLNEPALMTVGMQSLENYITHVKAHSSRLAPLGLLWYKPMLHDDGPTPTTCYVGHGKEVHIAMIRSAWHDRNASFIGIKGGDIRVNHGHMDIGSFIIEADGKRWAEDMGMEHEIYDRKDSWSTAQDSRRWLYLRANNLGHNTLTLGGNIQQVDGFNPILRNAQTPAMQYAILDMSTAYKDQATQVHRGIALLSDKSMIVQDDFSGIKPEHDLLWTMLTKAKITLAEDQRSATLSLDDKSMNVSILSPSTCTFTIKDATPPTDVEEPNKDYTRLLIQLPAPVADGSLLIHFTPGSPGSAPGSVQDRKTPTVTPLADWQ